jgi:hypothetical protein
MKYGKCRKCGKRAWLEKHHVYPKSKFKGQGKSIYLCPNCHTDYHQKLGEIKSSNPGFYLSFYMSWLWKTLAILIILGLIKAII